LAPTELSLLSWITSIASIWVALLQATAEGLYHTNRYNSSHDTAKFALPIVYGILGVFEFLIIGYLLIEHYSRRSLVNSKYNDVWCAVVAICHKSWGRGPGYHPPFSLPSRRPPGVWSEPGSPATKHFDTTYTNKDSKSLIKSTLVLNLPQKISVHVDFSAVGRTDAMDYRPCIASWH